MSVAVPGEVLAVIEEFMPGSNVFVENGEIASKVVGVVKRDLDNLVISVSPLKSPRMPRKEEVVYAYVVKVSDIYAVLKVFYIEDRKAMLLPPFTGTLHVMNVGGDYVKTIYDAMGYGDVVRAKVIVDRSPPFILSTRGRGLGVIFARCPYCMQPLKRRGFTLFCRNCRKTVKRKIASFYYIVR